MDPNLKKKIAEVKALIQKKLYTEALDELQVLMYKHSKAYQVHLMSGLCYDKLGKEEAAQKCYAEVIQIKEDEPNAIKALCEIYSQRGDIKKATVYLEKNVEILKKVDDKKYRDAIVKLVEIYRKDEDLEKILSIFNQYVESEKDIGEDFVAIGEAYFHVSSQCKSFNLQTLESMGCQNEQSPPRTVQANAREKLNILLMDVVNFLGAASKEFELCQRDISNTIYELKMCFPYAPCLLMLLLLDEYCTAHSGYSAVILTDIYALLCAYFKKESNSFLNLEYTEPEIFTVCMVMGYHYVMFFRQFFALDPCFDEFLEELALRQEEFLKSYKIREEYSRKINGFLLRKCRVLSQQTRSQDIEKELEEVKRRIERLEGSYLEEVVAKMAMNCFANYERLNDVKNMLKTRIRNSEEGAAIPHLYKYYVDYLLKIARIYKALDEEISIYAALEYINQHDPLDLKYRADYHWLSFSRSLLEPEENAQLQAARKSIGGLTEILPGLKGPLRGDCLRRVAVMKVFTGDLDVEKDLKEAVASERSFSNLQCMGFYLFHQKCFEDALSYLKEAFILNQSHYHTNRLIFVLLYKLGRKSEAIDFTERIKEGFRSVFWVNYVLALKGLNAHKFNQAENFLNGAIECYSSGAEGKFKFSYEKTVEHPEFAFVSMIRQNEFSILFDEFVLPEPTIYSELPMASSLHFRHNVSRTQIRLCTQMGEVLKVLGRTKSAANYLSDAFAIASSLSPEELNSPGFRFEICTMQKEYATILFYMKMYRESETVLETALSLCAEESGSQSEGAQQSELVSKLQTEIKSLMFQVSVERLSVMMKFESHETIDSYLKAFRVESPSRSSLNFLKAKYQFHILEYLHKRHHTNDVKASISNYLQSFALSLSGVESKDSSDTTKFDNRFFELSLEQRVMVREALEDYMVIQYISEPECLSEEQVMPLIQLFPRSSVFYIIFAMAVRDLRLKTAALIKCIQLDRESPVSIDLLASLYLKQKNYLAATKLFLKSLEVNILNTRCYLGLTICLLCIIGHTLSLSGRETLRTVRKALTRVSSYMEYLRSVDPSENYHLLSFLKLLVTDEKHSSFSVKLILEASRKNTRHKYRDTLTAKLLDDTVRGWSEHSIWKQEGHLRVVESLFLKFGRDSQNADDAAQGSADLARELLRRATDQLREINADRESGNQASLTVIEVEKCLHQISVCISLAAKAKFSQDLFSSIVESLNALEKTHFDPIQESEELLALVAKIKGYLFEHLIEAGLYREHSRTVYHIFERVKTYSHFAHHSERIPEFQKELFREVMQNPGDSELRAVLTNYMVVRGGTTMLKAKLSHKVELVHDVHANLLIQKQNSKKLLLLYHDPSLLLNFIVLCWQEEAARTAQNVRKWLKMIDQTCLKVRPEQTDLKSKLGALRVEMLSYYLSRLGKESEVQLESPMDTEERRRLSWLTLVSEFCRTQEASALKKIKSSLSEESSNPEDWNAVLIVLLSHMVKKYQSCPQIETIVQSFLSELQQSEGKGPEFKNAIKSLHFLQFLCTLGRKVPDEEGLMAQILDMQKVTEHCIALGAHSNTVAIMNCCRFLISADYERLEEELSKAASMRIVSYSDQIAINYYEIMRLYKEVQNSPNKEGVIESFGLYIEHMIALTQNDPFYQGFFYCLKAMVNSIVLPEEPFSRDRNLKMASLLSPEAMKGILQVNQAE